MADKKNNLKNIILITIDSLRTDFLGCCSSENKDITPNLDQFAEKSIIFENAIAQAPYTGASISSLFTSKYPRSTVTSDNMLREDNVTIAEILKKNGYKTAAFHSNPFLSKNFGFNRGFDTYHDTIFVKSRLHRLISKQPYFPASGVNKEVISWLRDNSTSPFFLWIHYMDPHGPYQSKKGFAYLNKIKAERLWRKAVKNPDSITENELKTLISNYKEEVRYLDQNLGVLFNLFDELNLTLNTIIIVTSDHGEEFREHGLFSHPRQLYDELIRVPLIIKLPNVGREQRIVRQVGLIDIVPTILDSLNLNRNNRFEGNSLLPLIEDENNEIFPDYTMSDATPDRDYRHICIRTDEWKYILNEQNGNRELYNLFEDPKEQANLIDAKKEISKNLEKKLLKNLPPKKPEKEPSELELDGELKQRLRDLGYFD